MPSSRQNVTPNVILWYQPIESSWQDLWSTTAIPPCKINFQGLRNVWFLLGPTCILTMTMPSTLCKNSLPKNTSTESHSWTWHTDSEGATNHTTPTMMQDNNASEISSWSRMMMISHAMQEFLVTVWQSQNALQSLSGKNLFSQGCWDPVYPRSWGSPIFVTTHAPSLSESGLVGACQ